MSKKRDKLKRLLMAAGLSILSVCTLNQIADAAIDSTSVKYKKTGLKNGMIRYQLEFNANEIKDNVALYLGAGEDKNELTDTADDNGNKIYLKGKSGDNPVYVIEVKSTEKKLTVSHKNEEGAEPTEEVIDIGPTICPADNAGPVVDWMCCGTDVSAVQDDWNEDTIKQNAKVVLHITDDACVDKIVALKATLEDDGTINGTEVGDPLVVVEKNELNKENLVEYDVANIPLDGDKKVDYIRVYDSLGNCTDVKALTESRGSEGPEIKWAYKSEDKVWTSSPDKEQNKVVYTPEEVNYIQFQAEDPCAKITKLLDQDGKDRTCVDEKLYENTITAKYRFRDKERYFFVENYFGYKTLVSLDGTKPGEANFPVAPEGYKTSERDCKVDVSYGVAAKNADGTNVAISMEIPKDKELISINTEEDVDLSYEKGIEGLGESTAVHTAKQEGEVRRGNDKLVATYVGAPEGTTHIDVMYGTRKTEAAGENDEKRTVAIESGEFANLDDALKIKIQGNFDMNELKPEEKVIISLDNEEEFSGLDATLKVVESLQGEFGNLAEVETCTDTTDASPHLYRSGAGDIDDCRYTPYNASDLRVIVPLGAGEKFENLSDLEKVIVPLSEGEEFENLSDLEKIKVPKLENDPVADNHQKINRDKTHMYKLGYKYDLTHKYDMLNQYDTTSKYDVTAKWDLYNKYESSKNVPGTLDEVVAGGAKEIPVLLDMDLVAPHVVKRAAEENGDGDIVTAGGKDRVYKNEVTSPTKALIEVTDNISGIAKIVAVVEDPEIEYKVAKVAFDKANKILNDLTVAEGNLKTAKGSIKALQDKLTMAVQAVGEVGVVGEEGYVDYGTKDYEDANAALSAAKGKLEKEMKNIAEYENWSYANPTEAGVDADIAAAIAECDEEDAKNIRDAKKVVDDIVGTQLELVETEESIPEAEAALMAAVRVVEGSLAGWTYNESTANAVVDAAIAALGGIPVVSTNDIETAKGRVDAIITAQETLGEKETAVTTAEAAVTTAEGALTEAVSAVGGYNSWSYATATNPPSTVEKDVARALNAAKTALEAAMHAVGPDYDDWSYAEHIGTVNEDVAAAILAAGEYPDKVTAIQEAKKKVDDILEAKAAYDVDPEATAALEAAVQAVGGDYDDWSYATAANPPSRVESDVAAALGAAKTALETAMHAVEGYTEWSYANSTDTVEADVAAAILAAGDDQGKVTAIQGAKKKVDDIITAKSNLDTAISNKATAEGELEAAQDALTTAVSAVEGYTEWSYDDHMDTVATDVAAALDVAKTALETEMNKVVGYEEWSYAEADAANPSRVTTDVEAAIEALEVASANQGKITAIQNAKKAVDDILAAKAAYDDGEVPTEEEISALEAAVKAVGGDYASWTCEGLEDVETDVKKALVIAKTALETAVGVVEEKVYAEWIYAEDEVAGAKEEATTTKTIAEAELNGKIKAYETKTLPGAEKKLAQAKASLVEAKAELEEAVGLLGEEYANWSYAEAAAADPSTVSDDVAKAKGACGDATKVENIEEAEDTVNNIIAAKTALEAAVKAVGGAYASWSYANPTGAGVKADVEGALAAAKTALNAAIQALGEAAGDDDLKDWDYEEAGGNVQGSIDLIVESNEEDHSEEVAAIVAADKVLDDILAAQAALETAVSEVGGECANWTYAGSADIAGEVEYAFGLATDALEEAVHAVAKWDYKADEVNAQITAAKSSAETAAGITSGNYDDEIDDALTAAKVVAVTAAECATTPGNPSEEDYSGVKAAFSTAKNNLTDAVRNIGGDFIRGNYANAESAIPVARDDIKTAIASARVSYENIIINGTSYETSADLNVAINDAGGIAAGVYAVATEIADVLSENNNSVVKGHGENIAAAVNRAATLDDANDKVVEIGKAIDKVEAITDAKEKVDNIVSACKKIEEIDKSITDENTGYEKIRSNLLAEEEEAAKARTLIDVRGLPKSVVQLMNLPEGAKYIKVYDGIGNCNTISIDEIDAEQPEKAIVDKDGIEVVNGKSVDESDGVAPGGTGLTIKLTLDADVDGTHIVQADYRSSTVGVKSFVRAADAESAIAQRVTPIRETMYGEKEFIKNEAYDYDDNDTWGYTYETLQTSDDIAQFYPVAPQISDIKGAQIQGEPYCWVVDAFDNVNMYNLNKVLFKGGVGGDYDDDEHYVMMDKDAEGNTNFISVKVEDLRRVKKISAMIDDEEIVLETFETGDTPIANDNEKAIGLEDVDRVYEIGGGKVGEVIIYHTNDKKVIKSHQNVVEPVYVEQETAELEETATDDEKKEAALHDRKTYVELYGNSADGYKAVVKYGIRRVDYSDNTVIEFYDETPKDVDVYLRGADKSGNTWVEITDALGYTYKINDGDEDSPEGTAMGNYPKKPENEPTDPNAVDPEPEPNPDPEPNQP